MTQIKSIMFLHILRFFYWNSTWFATFLSFVFSFIETNLTVFFNFFFYDRNNLQIGIIDGKNFNFPYINWKILFFDRNNLEIGVIDGHQLSPKPIQAKREHSNWLTTKPIHQFQKINEKSRNWYSWWKNFQLSLD